MLYLRFITGPRAGEHLALPIDGDLSLGRTADTQVQVPEEMVSRRHARLRATGGTVVLTDLGSTNGTFVNGRKIAEATLALDDRILVGSSVIQVVDEAGLAEAPRAAGGALAPPRAEATAALRGRLEQVPLPDLLQLLGRGKKTGTLTLGGQAPASIEMAGGEIVGVVARAFSHWTPAKALSRLLALESGSFDFVAAAPASAPAAAVLPGGLEAQLLEAARLRDELAGRRASWPEGAGGLALRAPLVPRLKDLTHRQLDILQAAMAATSVDAVLDAEAGPDAPVLTTLMELHNAGYLWPRPAGPPAPCGPAPGAGAGEVTAAAPDNGGGAPPD